MPLAYKDKNVLYFCM